MAETPPTSADQRTAGVAIELAHVLEASGLDSSPEAQKRVLEKMESTGWNVAGQQTKNRSEVRRVVGKKGRGDRLTPEHR